MTGEEKRLLAETEANLAAVKDRIGRAVGDAHAGSLLLLLCDASGELRDHLGAREAVA